MRASAPGLYTTSGRCAGYNHVEASIGLFRFPGLGKQLKFWNRWYHIQRVVQARHDSIVPPLFQPQYTAKQTPLRQYT